MTLEKDINQQVFRSEYQKSIINLIYTFNWVNEKLNRRFEPFDITQQQFNILRILRGAGQPLSTLQIRQRMLDRMSDTSRIVDRLILKGLANKAASLKDRRLVDIVISPKGIKLLEKLDTRQEELDGILGNISVKDAAALSKILDKIRNAG